MNVYLLARTAHLCVLGEHVVILDLRSGRYLGLPQEESATLGAWVQGWPIAPVSVESADGNPPAALRHLCDHGLLTTDPSLGKSAEPVRRSVRNTAYQKDRPAVAARIRIHHVVRMAWAIFFCVCAKRWMRLDRIVERVRRRKERGAAVIVSKEREAELLRIYHSLRPFFYSTSQRCMLHCMALSEFLAGFGVYPEWVFGVRTKPFQAHCWLDRDGDSLTDSPLNVDRMTPIMIV